MKTLGLIGGLSWESTVPYYRIINEAVKAKLGGLHSAKILLSSVDFGELEPYLMAEDWAKCAELMVAEAKKLQQAGADYLVICTNTMHKVVPQIRAQVQLPLIHIAEATAHELVAAGVQKVALLGTKYTLQQDFYKQVLIEKGLEVILPAAPQIEAMNDVIYNELCLGQVREEARQLFREIIQTLQQQGAEAVIFGCTEIGMLLQQADSVLPVFDTTEIHAKAAAAMALKLE